MINAVMLVCNRPLLTNQAISTFISNTRSKWTLTIIDDGSNWPTRRILDMSAKHESIQVIHLARQTFNTARCRNLGVYWSEKEWPRSSYLYLSDNDAYFTPDWDVKLICAFQLVEDLGFKLLGPYRHPYHHPLREEVVVYSDFTVQGTDAVQGLGHLMRWETWDTYGPLIWHPGTGKGTNQSEDWWFCQQIRKDGFKVGSIEPSVVLNCGISGTDGRPSPGAEVLTRYEGIYME